MSAKEFIANMPLILTQPICDDEVYQLMEAYCREILHSWRERRVQELEGEREFIAASVAVWREIDSLSAKPGGYSSNPLLAGTDLRIAEKKAWEAYRAVLDRKT